MKPKASTMAQRFGFADPDLTTPAHDSLLMWLSENIEEIIQLEAGQMTREIFRHRNGAWRPISQNDLTQQECSEVDKHPLGETIFHVKQIWECPILDRSYTIGFCDMKVIVTREIENGTIDIDYSGVKVSDRKETADKWMEIKPSIPSVGELIRQLRMYQTYTSGDKWFVVSPDTRFRSQIESQGFGFIEAPSSL